MRRRGALLTALALSATSVSAGASLAQGEPPVCTLIGCYSGVSLVVKDPPEGTKLVVFCVEQRCKRIKVAKKGPPPKVGCQAADSAQVTAIPKGKGGVRLGRATATVPLQVSQPNGPGCPPTCYFGRVRLEGLKLAPI